jgi:hypothetical protein
MDEVRKGTFTDVSGRPLPMMNDRVPFFAYVICDLTRSLRAKMVRHDFDAHPDGQGFFDFRKTQRAYIEVISYDKLLGDAKKRNRVLFDRLNLPT